MSGTIQFHLDENVSNAIAQALRRRGINVTTTPEQGLISISDSVTNKVPSFMTPA